MYSSFRETSPLTFLANVAQWENSIVAGDVSMSGRVESAAQRAAVSVVTEEASLTRVRSGLSPLDVELGNGGLQSMMEEGRLVNTPLANGEHREARTIEQTAASLLGQSEELVTPEAPESSRQAEERVQLLTDPGHARAQNAGALTGASAPDALALLQDATRLIQSLSVAHQASLEASKHSRLAVKVAVPTYRSYADTVSVTDFIKSLTYYQAAVGLDDSEMLTRIVPAALVERAAQWYRLSGRRATTLDEFKAALRREFLPVDYQRRMRRELEPWTQAPDESLLEYVRTLEELFQIAEPSASNDERVERVVK
ncbi:uncharacterized protein LOC144116147 [Amblyomma americanum]